MLKTASTAARHLKRSSSGMFKPLGLLSGYQCSDSPCRRLHCFFNHGESSKAPQLQWELKRKASDISAEVSAKRNTHSLAGNPAKVVPPRQGVAAKVQPAAKARPISPTRVEIGARGTPSSVISGSKSSTAVRPTGIVSKPQTTPRPGPAKPASVLSGSPSVKAHLEPLSVPKTNLQLSPQPWTDRQKALQTIFGQYTKLFAAVLPSAPDLAHTTSLAEEAEISATSSANLRVYKTAIHQAAVSISRRPPPDTLTHPSVGTIKQSRVKHEAIATIKASKPSRDRIEQYCLSTEELIEWGFPNPTDENLVTNGGEEPDLEGSSQKCHRCKVLFVVDSKNLESRMGECSHHYGKLRPERVEGMRKWLYTCCKRERGGAGCEDGVHAFREEDDFYLHRRKGFRRVNQITSKGGGWLDVVAMDCEMVSTTSGSSLARVTIVDEDGGILLDELVRQTVPVLDLNTRFSGVTPGQLESAVMDLEAVRSAACVFIGPETIIVGHGLENDLRALRLMHDKVIDTAVLFPHDKGKPFRRPLRDIVKETLGYFIQDRTADLGHSSAEDAKATLDVLKWKVRTE